MRFTRLNSELTVVSLSDSSLLTNNTSEKLSESGVSDWRAWADKILTNLDSLVEEIYVNNISPRFRRKYVIIRFCLSFYYITLMSYT